SDLYSSLDFTLDSSSSGSSLDSLLDTFSGSPLDSLSNTSSVHSLGFDALEAVADLGISDGVGVNTEDGIGMGVKIAASDIREYEEEFEAEASVGGTMEIIVDPLVTGGISESTRGDVLDLEGTLYDIVHYMSEVDSLRHYMALSQEEFRQICMDRNDARRRLGRTMTNTRSGMTLAAIEEMINRRVAEALEAREANRNLGLRNVNDEGGNGNGDGNGNGGNGNGNHNDNDRGARPVVQDYTYQDFMRCQPLNFKGTEGFVGLIRTIGTDAAFSMSWRELMKLMAEVYCPRNEIQKMESEL
ncbi:hypothetical protein Tco_1479745, partial [Tanacetum coccineum]